MFELFKSLVSKSMSVPDFVAIDSKVVKMFHSELLNLMVVMEEMSAGRQN